MKTIEINNKHYIDAKVVMLTTDKKSNLYTVTDGTLMFINNPCSNDSGGKHQHLYITSDEEIKEGDWFYSDEFSKPEQAKIFERNLVNGFIKSACRKIIATTDSSLEIPCKIKCHDCNGTGDSNHFISGMTGDENEISHCNRCNATGLEDNEEPLPQPSKEFIQSYIESYNKGEVITDVLVEVDDKCKNGNALCTAFNGNCPVCEKQLKLKDNTIIIQHTKDNYSLNEILNS